MAAFVGVAEANQPNVMSCLQPLHDLVEPIHDHLVFVLYTKLKVRVIQVAYFVSIAVSTEHVVVTQGRWPADELVNRRRFARVQNHRRTLAAVDPTQGARGVGFAEKHLLTPDRVLQVPH